MAFLCIDIGGTNTLLGVGDEEFEIVEKRSSQDFLQDVEGTAEDILNKAGYQKEGIEKVAIAAAGPIDREQGVFYPPNFYPDTGLEEVPLKQKIEEIAEEIHIINDCSSAALGEFYYGEEPGEDMVYITISSGIGAGVISDGELLEGWNGNFGEIGHIKISEREIDCGCGGQGHWEAFCSGNNLPDMAQHLFGANFDDAREIFESYDRGDQEAEKVIEEMQRLNSAGIADVINAYNPEKIAIGGAVALNHPERVVEPLEADVRAESINQVPEISLCSLEERSVLHGLRAVCNGLENDSKL